jgi:hypothetical protein
MLLLEMKKMINIDTVYKVGNRTFSTYLEAKKEEEVQSILACCYGYRDNLVSDNGSTNARSLLYRLLEHHDIQPKRKG